jgi:hypothetical protein
MDVSNEEKDGKQRYRNRDKSLLIHYYPFNAGITSLLATLPAEIFYCGF